ncbi:MAG: adenylate/guanylate cyclase domain-containing protein [bacterium]|nr:adenylate/guanylate cyclase domain-containing protein [bacterium]
MAVVLIVDDNADNRQLLTDIAESMKLETLQAANGGEAIQLAHEKLPDLIILDVNMPGMSGFEVCALLKGNPRTGNIPVIMLTAMTDVDHKVEGLRLGADDYVAKPFNPRELMERMRTRLRSKSNTDELLQTQQMIRDTFERYVSRSVVEQLLRDPEQVKLGGTLGEITVMFSDLENFTSISEQSEPNKLLLVLNAYHTMVVETIQECGGTVDKFIGDGVMALYNTPLVQSDHALRAVRTAMLILERMPAFQQQFEPLYHTKINFGIHTGQAVVGNVGAPNLMNYTAVGDTVNLAARLQSIAAHGQILISSATQAYVAAHVQTQSMGSMKIRGRREEVVAYEVISAPTQP